MGANDTANSMSIAVGAGAITPKQAVLIAGILEFRGTTSLERVSQRPSEKASYIPIKSQSRRF